MSDVPSDISLIRRRPGMYIGDVRDGSGLVHMVWELLANSLDEHLAGACGNISIIVNDDGSVAVRDDGRGIPTHTLDGVPFAQRALTSLHHTPTLDGHAPHEHVGLSGIGLVAVNALSSRLTLEIHRDGRCHVQVYERGAPLGVLEDTGPTKRTGTTITFVPDPLVFADPWMDAGKIAARLRELACLLPSLTLSFVDRRKHEFREADGLQAFLRRTRADGERVLSTLTVNDRINEILVEVAAEWRDHPASSIDSYANILRTTDGGTHVDGLTTGLALALRDINGRRGHETELDHLRAQVCRGLHAVVCVRLDDPTFDAPTKSRLMTPEVTEAVSAVVRRAFSRELETSAELRRHWGHLETGDIT